MKDATMKNKMPMNFKKGAKKPMPMDKHMDDAKDMEMMKRMKDLKAGMQRPKC